jgi:anti-sigma B factor antagonist
MHDSTNPEFDMETSGDTVLFRPKGEIDLSVAPALRTHLREAADRTKRRLIVDLADVPYMDSSGVATLVEALQLTRRSGKQLLLCNLHEKVQSIFEIARLDAVFTIVATVEDARTR